MFWRLLSQEVRALPRSRFGLLAAATWLTIVTLMTAFILGTEGNALYSILVVIYVVPALALLPITAGYVSSDRSTRFVQSVFTSPVRASDYLLAKIAPPLLLAMAYWIATMPFFVVFAYLAGVPPLLTKFASVALLLTFVTVSVGGLIGVLFVGRSTAAPIGAGTALAVFSAAAEFFIPAATAMPLGLGRETFLRVLHVSPLVLTLDALDLHGMARAQSPLASLVALIGMGIAALAVSLWIFTRHQSAETWEVRGVARVLVPLALTLVLVSPAALAAPDYAATIPPQNASYGNPNVTVLFVDPNGMLGDHRSFPDPFPIEEWVQVDLLLLFRGNLTLPMSDLRISSAGPEIEFKDAVVARVDAPELHPMDDGRMREVVRVPADALFHSPGHLGRTHLIVKFLLEWEDSNGAHAEHGDQMVWVHKPGAAVPLVLAGLPSILLCLGSYSVRRWRIR